MYLFLSQESSSQIKGVVTSSIMTHTITSMLGHFCGYKLWTTFTAIRFMLQLCFIWYIRHKVTKYLKFGTDHYLFKVCRHFVFLSLIVSFCFLASFFLVFFFFFGSWQPTALTPLSGLACFLDPGSKKGLKCGIRFTLSSLLFSSKVVKMKAQNTKNRGKMLTYSYSKWI